MHVTIKKAGLPSPGNPAVFGLVIDDCLLLIDPFVNNQ
jgi:hypothetical protein